MYVSLLFSRNETFSGELFRVGDQHAGKAVPARALRSGRRSERNKCNIEFLTCFTG